MTSIDFVYVTAAEDVKDHYEQLRQNALGHFSEPCGLLLFLQQGMSGWLRAISNMLVAPVSEYSTTLVNTTDNALVHIVVDAIIALSEPVTTGDC